MRKICSHEASYHWTVGFTTRQISHFVASKLQKMSWRILSVHGTVAFRTRQNRIFWLPKWWKSAGRLPSIDFTLSTNSPSSFRQLTIQFPLIDHQVSVKSSPVSFNRPSSFRQKTVQIQSIDTNRIYRPPNSRKYINKILGTHDTYVLRLGKNRIFWHHTEENSHTLRKEPNHWFHETAEIAFSVHKYA